MLLSRSLVLVQAVEEVLQGSNSLERSEDYTKPPVVDLQGVFAFASSKNESASGSLAA